MSYLGLVFVFTLINSMTLKVKVKQERTLLKEKRVRVSFPHVHPTVHQREGGKQLSTHKYLNVSLDAVSWGRLRRALGFSSGRKSNPVKDKFILSIRTRSL